MKPLYMWAGGKSKLIKRYDGLLSLEGRTSYVEPFFGGGAIYGFLKESVPELQATVNDINEELMGVLEAIKASSSDFIAAIEPIALSYLAIPTKLERKAYYYELRKSYWANPTPALLYLLMKLGFNGIWQTCKESKGLFGTPAGLLNQTSLDQIIPRDLIVSWGKALQTTSIQSGDYRDLKFDPKGALVYLDPPYRDSFTTYGTGFNDDHQREVVEWSLELASKGARVLLANRCVEGDDFFEKLLPDATFHYFDVTYTAGRRLKTEAGFEAKKAREFLAVI